MSSRRPTDRRTFGFYRAEILAAVLNSLILFGVAALIIWQAWQRLSAEPTITSGLMIAIAIVGAAGNLVSLRVLRDAQRASLNMRGAYLEVMGDLFGSLAVIAAGVVIALTGLTAADSVASIAIALLIVPRTWGLLRDAIDVLLEATPRGMALSEVREHLLKAEGVIDVHDLHIWTITSGMKVASAHVVLRDGAKPAAVLTELNECLATDFDVEHSTIQLETEDRRRYEEAHHA
jgi:cobalt-zinc-cadmium efflux system protein